MIFIYTQDFKNLFKESICKLSSSDKKIRKEGGVPPNPQIKYLLIFAVYGEIIFGLPSVKSPLIRKPQIRKNGPKTVGFFLVKNTKNRQSIEISSQEVVLLEFKGSWWERIKEGSSKC